MLILFSCQSIDDESQKIKIIPPHLTMIDSTLNMLDQIYQDNSHNEFQPDTLKQLQSVLQILDTIQLKGFEYLSAKALRLEGAHLENIGTQESINASLKKYKTAEQLLQSNLITTEAKKELGEANNLLGLYYQNIDGEYGLAENYHQKYFDIQKELNSITGLAIAFTNLGATYFKTERLEEAETALLKSDSIWKSLEIQKRDSISFMGTYHNMAELFLEKGKQMNRLGLKDKAEFYFKEGIDKNKFVEKGLSNIPPSLAASLKFITYNNLAVTYAFWNNGEHPDSIIHYSKKTIQHAEDTFGGVPPQLAPVFGNIARGYALKKDFISARKNLIKGLKLLTGKSNSQWFMNNQIEMPSSLRRGFASLCNNRAKILGLEGKEKGSIPLLKKSLDQYSFTLNWLEKMRIDYSSDIAKEANSIIFSDYANDAIQTTLILKEKLNDSKYLDIAHNFTERVKSFLIRNTASFEYAGLNYSGEKQSLWEKEQSFKKQIFTFETNGVKDSLIATRRNYYDFIESLKDDNASITSKSYYLDRFADNIPSIPEIQKEILTDKSAIVEYYLYGGQGLIFVISKNDNQVIPFTLPDKFYITVNTYSQFLKDGSNNTKLKESAYQLYQTLIQPIKSDIDGIEYLTIIPDKQIGNIVFENLLIKPLDTTWKDSPYLLHDYIINYEYSLASTKILNKLSKARKQPSKKMGIYVAYGTEKSKEEWGCGNSLSLTHMENTMKKVKDGLSPEEVDWKNDKNGTITNFKNTGIDCEILHLTLHACFEEDRRTLNNYLQFHPDQNDNGQLTVAEIYNLPIKTRLAVLSSCNTGQGSIDGNEGLKSIGRAFAISGCPTIIAALDNVEDKAMAILLEYFYRYLLEEGDEIHVALKKAKLGYLNDPRNAGHTHPKYWANIICIGNPNALK